MELASHGRNLQVTGPGSVCWSVALGRRGDAGVLGALKSNMRCLLPLAVTHDYQHEQVSAADEEDAVCAGLA